MLFDIGLHKIQIVYTGLTLRFDVGSQSNSTSTSTRGFIISNSSNSKEARAKRKSILSSKRNSNTNSNSDCIQNANVIMFGISPNSKSGELAVLFLRLLVLGFKYLMC